MSVYEGTPDQFSDLILIQQGLQIGQINKLQVTLGSCVDFSYMKQRIVSHLEACLVCHIWNLLVGKSLLEAI